VRLRLAISVIAAVRSLAGSAVEPALLARMLGAGRLVEPRGQRPPEADIEATWADGEVGLGKARLWLTDQPRPGPLPMHDEQRELVLAWYGRLDNRDDLLTSLGSGLSRPAPPDEALVLDAYARWGVTCVERLLGDFAFVLWDRRARRLFAATDHFGLRPLYYAFDGSSLVVASRIGQVLEGARLERRLNEPMIANYLGLNPANPDETPFQGVWRVPAAHVLQHDRGASAPLLWRYWELRERPPITYRTNEEYIEHFREVGGKAIGSRLRGPHPVGVMLSGGLDSATIACMASELIDDAQSGDGRLATFTAVFNRLPEADERRYVEALVAHGGFESHYVAADDMWTFNDGAPREGSWDEPFEGMLGDFTELVFDGAQQQGVRVLLDGHGGNQLFGGNMYYLFDLLLERRWSALSRELRCWPWRARPGIVRRYVLAPLCSGWPRCDMASEMAHKAPVWIRSEFAARCDAERRLRTVHPPRFHLPSRNLSADAIALIQEWGGLRLLQSGALRRGIDLRHPLFDIRLIDFFMRIPSSQKAQNRCDKVLIRRAMKHSFPAIVTQPRGPTPARDFTKLLDRGRREHQRSRWEALLAEDFHLAQLGYVDQEALRDALARYVTGETSRVSALANTFRLEQWLRHAFSGGNGDASRAATTGAKP
jgi:asparagine synthase (glutamine-hydrolysing)